MTPVPWALPCTHKACDWRLGCEGGAGASEAAGPVAGTFLGQTPSLRLSVRLEEPGNGAVSGSPRQPFGGSRRHITLHRPAIEGYLQSRRAALLHRASAVPTSGWYCFTLRLAPRSCGARLGEKLVMLVSILLRGPLVKPGSFMLRFKLLGRVIHRLAGASEKARN